MSILAANWTAPALRARLRTETMLTVSLAFVAVCGIAAGISGVFIAGVLLAAVVNAAAAFGRVAFEATVQADASHADKVGAFARFETQNQLAWVAGGLVPVVLRMDGHTGSWCVGVLGAVGMALMLRDRLVTAPRGGPATGRARRARWGSAGSSRR
jgi:membrane associated rhomboid family serine protease